MLGTHGVTAIMQGSPIVALIGDYIESWPLAGNQVDQPFTMSGTSITRVELPLNIATGIGGDVVVALYADSGGIPTGSPLASVTLPVGFLSAVVGNPAFPGQNALGIGEWVGDGITPLPPVPLNSYFLYAWATDGTSVVIVGGWNGTMPVAACASTTSALQWQQQPVYPVALYGSAAVIVSGSVIVVGGADASNAPHADVNSASIDGSGTVGGWTAQTPLPSAVIYPTAAASGTTMYVIGGENPLATQTNTVWSATVTNGAPGAWTALGNYPIPVSLAQAVVINGWLVVMGGASAGVPTAAVYAARISASGGLGPWLAWPSLPVPLQEASALVIGNAIHLVSGITTGGWYAAQGYTMAVGAGGPGVWATQPPGYAGGVAAATFGGATTYLFAHVGSPYSGLEATSAPYGVLSVPLNATGLTNGNTYHIVMQVANTLPDATVTLVFGGIGTQAQYRQISAGGGAFWNPIPGSLNGYVPLTIYSGASGRMVHTLADVTSGVAARWTWLIWSWWGTLVGVGEWTAPGNTRSFRAIEYDGSGSGLPVNLA